MEEQQSVAESMDGSPLEFHELAAELLATAYEDEGGQPPSALSEEGFLDAEAAALAAAEQPPSAHECCVRVHRRCVYDAVNEALESLSQPPPPPRGLAAVMRSGGRGVPSSPHPRSLSGLLATARQARFAKLSLEETTQKVLALLPEPKAAPPPPPPPSSDGSDDEEALAERAAAAAAFAASLPDDVGTATRLLWKELSGEWSSFGQDEWELAKSEITPRKIPSAAELLEARAKRAAELFWQVTARDAHAIERPPPRLARLRTARMRAPPACARAPRLRSRAAAAPRPAGAGGAAVERGRASRRAVAGPVRARVAAVAAGWGGRLGRRPARRGGAAQAAQAQKGAAEEGRRRRGGRGG